MIHDVKMKKLRFSFALISSQGNFNALRSFFGVDTHIIFWYLSYGLWISSTHRRQDKNTGRKLFTRITLCILYSINIYRIQYIHGDVKSYVCGIKEREFSNFMYAICIKHIKKTKSIILCVMLWCYMAHRWWHHAGPSNKCLLCIT